MPEDDEAPPTGFCVVDALESVATALQCPVCEAEAVECTPKPHTHRCHGCGLGGLVYLNEDGLWESDV